MTGSSSLDDSSADNFESYGEEGGQRQFRSTFSPPPPCRVIFAMLEVPQMADACKSPLRSQCQTAYSVQDMQVYEYT